MTLTKRIKDDFLIAGIRRAIVIPFAYLVIPVIPSKEVKVVTRR